MSPPHRSCIFPGCRSLQGNGAVSLFKFPTDDNVRKRWINFVMRSYCGEFNITTNTRLCSGHFTPDSYSNCHQVKSGYPKSPLTLVSGAEPTLSVPACILPSRRQRTLSSPPSALCASLLPPCCWLYTWVSSCWKRDLPRTCRHSEMQEESKNKLFF